MLGHKWSQIEAEFFRDLGGVYGEANYIKSIGDINLRKSRNDDA